VLARSDTSEQSPSYPGREFKFEVQRLT